MNSRLDELQAAVLRARLAVLPEFTARRRALGAQYLAGIRNSRVELMAAPVAPENHVYHLFVVRCAQRERLSEHLKNSGIESLCHYPVPVHRQPPCKDIARDALGMAHTERHAAQCLSLPCHPQLSDDNVAKVISAVNAFQ